jgi:hypothetical protein
MTRSKTIQIFLKDSDPQGIKIAELTNSIAKVYVIPRDKMSFSQSRVDLDAPALYFLFDDERTSVYIGECESFVSRVKNHEVNKDFWHTAVVVTGNGAGLDKAEVKFLESHAVMKALEAGRYEVQNRTNPNKNNLHEFRLAAILDFFEDAILLLSSLGFNLFDPLDRTTPSTSPSKPIVKEHKVEVRDYDTVVCPATGDGLERAFKAKNAWWAIRIGQNNIKKLKYVSIYEAAPISAIRYYAKITKIEPYAELPGKYIIYHDGNIVEFEHHIGTGDTPQLSPYGPRYYKLEDMLSSRNLAELTDKTYGSNYQGK